MKRIILIAVLLGAVVSAAKTQHARLSPLLFKAKSIYIENDTGRQAFTDKCYQELSKWGRFQVVSDPAQADLIFRIGSHSTTGGYVGNASDPNNVTMTQTRRNFTTIEVLDHDRTLVLWSDTRVWSIFGSATKAVVKEFRHRLEEQESH